MTDTTARQGFREWLRTTFETPVKLQFGESQMLEAKTLNLAQGGMFVPMKQPKPVGTLVRFELELPDSRASVAGFGEVVWLRVRNEGPELPPGVGIQFRYLSDVDRQRIREVAQLIVADATKREAAAEAAALAAATPRPAMATASRAATG
nr:PilZ domain-containing protein [Thermoanaerobaculia bacterium]